MKKHHLLIGLLGLSYGTMHAQSIEAWEARPSVSLNYNIDDKWSVKGTYYLYLYDDFSDYGKSVLGAKASYKINNWLKASLDYRYGMMPGRVDYHDFRYSLDFKHKIAQQWVLTYRPTFQQELSQGYAPENYLRNKLTLGYDISSRVNLFLFTENYLALHNGGDFYREKTGLGTSVEPWKHSEFELEVILINNRREPNEPLNEGQIKLSYTYTFS